MYRKCDLSNKIKIVLHKKITVREINRHLNTLIKELLEKHGQVSNPDFERDLQATAGIGWKQVKNYQNHPQPDKAVNDNSKIKKFVLDRRRHQLWLRVTSRRFLLLSSATISLILMVAGVALYWNAHRKADLGASPTIVSPRSSQEIAKARHAAAGKISISVKKYGLTLKLGPITQSLADFKEMKCETSGSRRTCSYTGPMLRDGPTFQLVLAISDGSVTMVNVLSADPNIFAEWMAQVQSQLASNGFKHDQQQDVWVADGEVVKLSGNRIVVMWL